MSHEHPMGEVGGALRIKSQPLIAESRNWGSWTNHNSAGHPVILPVTSRVGTRNGMVHDVGRVEAPG